MLNKEELLNKAKQTVISKEKNKPLITKEELMSKAYTKRAATQNDINLINNVFSSAKNYANVIKNVSYGNVGEAKQQRQTLLNQVKVAKNTLKFLDIDQVEKDKLNKDIDDILTGLDDDISLLDEAEKMYAQFGSEEEYNQAVESVNFASDEKKAEIENKKKQQKVMADIIDRYERSKYENYNIDPLKENPVAGPQGVIKELANNGLIFDDLQIENGDVAKFEEKLMQKYAELSGEIESYDATVRAIDFEKQVQEYKAKFTEDGTFGAWKKQGAKDYASEVAYSNEMTADEKQIYNALAHRAGQGYVSDADGLYHVVDGVYVKAYKKQQKHNYGDKDIAEDLGMSVDEWKKIKSDVAEYLDYSAYLEDAIAQRKGVKVSDAIKGKVLLQELYSLWGGVNSWGQGVTALLTGDSKANATNYASAMVRDDLVKNNEEWGSLLGMLYDAGTSTGQMLPSIALAYATGGTATAFGASAKTAQLVSNLTFKTTFGASAYGNAYTEMINAGYNEGQAKAYATLSASSEVLLQELLGGVGKFAGKLTNSAITKAIENIDNAFLKVISSSTIAAGGEFTEEALQEVLSPIFKALVTSDIDPIKWGDVIYAGTLGALTSFASNTPEVITTAGRPIVQAVNNIGLKLSQKGIKNLAVSSDVYTFAATMPEYTTSYKLANVVRKGGNAYNMLSELAYANKPLTDAQSTEFEKMLIDDGYTPEVARNLVASAVKVSKGISIPNIQKQAIELNPVLTSALLDSIAKQDAKTLGITAQYEAIHEDATPSRNAVYDKITQKTPQTAENAQTTGKTKNNIPKGREVLKAPKHSPVHKISDTVYKTTEAGKLSAEQTSKAEEVIKKIGKRIGYDVEFVNKDFVENGHTVPGKIDHENKKIFINRDAKKSIEWLTRHEVTHSTEAKKSYGKFIKQIKKTAVYKDWLRLKSQSDNTIQEMEAAIRNSKRKNYAAQNETLSVTDADYELFADFVADMLFNEESGIDRLLNELDKPTRTKFVEWILDLLDSFKAVFSEEARQLQEIKRLEKKFAKLLTETKMAKSEGESKQYTLTEIVGKDGTNYGIGVYLDSTLLTNLTDAERKEMVKEYVKELGGQSFSAFDKKGKEVVFNIAESKEKYINQKGKKVQVNKDLKSKYSNNKTKQESIALIDELVLASSFDNSKPAKYSHDWVDNYGKNDWEYWHTYLCDKENTIWEATLNIATSTNGEKILYDIDPIKNIGRSVESDTIPTKNNIPQTKPSVKQFSLEENDRQYLSSERFKADNKDIRYSLEENETRPFKEVVAEIGKEKTVSSEALNAYNNGYMPKSLWTKEMFVYAIHEINPNINVAEMPLEKLQTYLKKQGTFETGKIPRQTDFYGIDTEVVKNLTQLKVDNFITNAEDFTLEKQSTKPSNKASEYADRIDELGTQLRGGDITLDEYKNAIDSLYKEAGEKHGTIKSGEMVTGDEDFSNPVPQNVGKGMPTRRFVRTAMEATPSEINDILTPAQEAEILKGKNSYVRTSNNANIENALKSIADGADYKTWHVKINDGSLLTANDIALGELLLEGAFEKGDAGMALKLIAELSEVGTRLGQAVQALSLLKRMGGMGKLLYVQQAVKTINKDLEKKAFIPQNKREVKIKEELAVQLADSKTDADFDIAYTAILQDIASQIPSTFMDRWNAWRYMAMLANPVTVLRNLFGNAFFVPVVMTTNFIATIGESVFMRNSNNRTKTFFAGKEYRDFAKKDWQEVYKALMSGGKYNISSEIDNYRTIFKLKPLEAVRKGYSFVLEGTDQAFMKGYYENALSRYLAANKLDLSKLTKEDLKKAREYAANYALKATYRDANAVAQWLSQGAKNKWVGWMIEGVIPFKKTPINVFRRGIEYSPLGLITTTGKALNMVAKKEWNGSEFIDGLASAGSGSALFVLGMWLSAAGFVNGGFDDEDEMWRKLNGEKEYSITVDGKSYTIDWMAPACMPFFMGAEVYKALNANGNMKVDISTILEACGNATDIIVEMSMLQGVQRLLGSIKFTDIKGTLISLAAEIGTSFITQNIPTVLGKIANTIDDTRRTNYIDKTDGFTMLQDLWNQVVAKIPLASQERPAYTNAWGQEEKTGPLWQRALQNFVSPGYFSTDKYTEVSDEITQLYKETGDKSILPENAPKYISFKNTTKHLTADEYYNYATMRGQKNADYLAELVASKEYANLDDAAKVKIIKDIYAFSNAYAKSYIPYTYDEIVAMDIVDVDEETYNRYSDKTKIALAKSYFLKNYTDEIKLEKNGGSVVQYYIKEANKKPKESKKQNVSQIIEKYA